MLRRLGAIGAALAVLLLGLAPASQASVSIVVLGNANLGSVSTGTATLTAQLGLVTAAGAGLIGVNVTANVTCSRDHLQDQCLLLVRARHRDRRHQQRHPRAAHFRQPGELRHLSTGLLGGCPAGPPEHVGHVEPHHHHPPPRRGGRRDLHRNRHPHGGVAPSQAHSGLTRRRLPPRPSWAASRTPSRSGPS
jgi:hypothetical protein